MTPPDSLALRARRDDWTREVVTFSDIRLLVPALAAWALLALTLSL